MPKRSRTKKHAGKPKRTPSRAVNRTTFDNIDKMLDRLGGGSVPLTPEEKNPLAVAKVPRKRKTGK